MPLRRASNARTRPRAVHEGELATMVYLLGLLAACSFALGSVLQQKGTLEVAAPEGDPHFLGQILRRPVWLAGAGCQFGGWVLQAAALDRGPLTIVQSLTTMSLVIALPLGARLTDQAITARVTLGAVAIVAGIILFLTAASPHGGTSSPSASAWWVAGIASVAIMAVLSILGRRHRGAPRALLFGSAAGVGFGLQSAVTKVFVTLIGAGLSALVSSWTTYVLIASALAGFVLQQSALKTGVLAPAVAASNSVTLLASILLGVTVFDEPISSGGLAPAVVGLTIAFAGIVLLAGSEPRREGASDPRDRAGWQP
jgi:drug/metabolite transporter (DMT)-like permease